MVESRINLVILESQNTNFLNQDQLLFRVGQSAILLSCIVFFLGMNSCANIVPPSGGDKDVTPPELLSMSPKDSMLNTRVNKINLHFNKFMEVNELQKQMAVSPLMEIPPTVMVNGKKIEIKLVDSLLLPNTTYRISLGNALTDNREKTSYNNFVYTFSTGSYFDSMQVQGQVFDAFTTGADTGVLVGLYPENFPDSLLGLKKPAYTTFTNGDGTFKFESLPQRAFKIFAFEDLDADKIYGKAQEKIGFLSTTINPQKPLDTTASPILLFTSLAAATPLTDTSSNDTLEKKFWLGRVQNKSKNAKPYMVAVDTINKENGTFELKGTLNITFNTVIGAIDSGKIFLSALSPTGIELEAPIVFQSDSVNLKLHHAWLPETRYTLRLVKGWAKDSSNNELPPSRYTFLTKSLSAYGEMSLKIPDTLMKDNHILVIHQEKDTIFNGPITDSMFRFNTLKPGNYQAFIIVDENGNSKWDPGNVFQGLQAEKMIHHETPLMLKAGWQQDFDFKILPLGSKANQAASKKERVDTGRDFR